jgi:hypothetical protein
MKKFKATTYELPSHWASALINDDRTGLSDQDERELDEWLGMAKRGHCVGCSDDPQFKRSNDAGTLACEVLEFTFHG